MIMAKEFFSPGLHYAVIGATTNPAKYGYQVLVDLFKAGLKVSGVNPKHRNIQGVPVFSSLSDVPDKPDVAVFVVPPAMGLTILDEVAKLGIKLVWFQPGADSDEIRAKVKALGLKGKADGSCIMVARRRFGVTI